MPSQGIAVIVKFPAEILTEHQGPALLHMEMELRKATGLDVRVMKDLQGDDSKWRRTLTIQQREAL